MQIEITTKKIDGAERRLGVSVPVDAVRDAEEQAAKRYAGRVRLPGFRPGKAPAAMVRKRFGEAIRQEAIESLVQEAYKQVLDQEKLTPVAQPHVHDLKFDEGAPLTFELHVEVRPEVLLERTAGFRVTKQPVVVSDDQLAEQIEHLREEKASWAPLTEDRPAPGDLVTAQLATAEAGADMPEAREFRLLLGSGQAIPGIEELVMEASAGETVERTVKWPDDFPVEAERGQVKRVRVTVTEAKRKALPDLDDAFAREVGDFDSLQALRTAVRADLMQHAERSADADVRQRLIDDIVSANPFDVPRTWVQELITAYAQAYQVADADRPRFETEFKAMAERQVRRDIVIDTLAGREKLTATEAEIDVRIADVAQKRGADPGQVYASLQKAGRLREIERSITEDKVFTWLLERNTVE
jgi:trigger factor